MNLYRKSAIKQDVPEILVVQLVKSYVQKETTTQAKRIKTSNPNLVRKSVGNLILEQITSVYNNSMEADKKTYYPTTDIRHNTPPTHSTTDYSLSSPVTHFDYAKSNAKLPFNTAPILKHKSKKITANELLLYQEMIKHKINSRLIYPTLARKKGIEGKVGVGFLVLKNGRILDIKVQNSSNSILNQAAIKTIKHAGPFSPIPDTLGIEELRLSLVISFKLE
jgi:TonB family protein